ncbi:MAG: hypothetical protein V1808_02355 [Candidatus Daviesbacteria bacterium]
MEGISSSGSNTPNSFPLIRMLGFIYRFVAILFVIFLFIEIGQGGLSFFYIMYGVPVSLLAVSYFFMAHKFLNHQVVSRLIVTLIIICSPFFALFMYSGLPGVIIIPFISVLITIALFSLYVIYFSSRAYFNKPILDQTIQPSKDENKLFNGKRSWIIILIILLIPAFLFLSSLIRGLIIRNEYNNSRGQYAPITQEP